MAYAEFEPLEKNDTGCETDALNIYFSQIPDNIKPYLDKIVDVKSDGNCGFRCVASLLGMSKNEEDWPRIRMEFLKELKDRKVRYKELYGGGFNAIESALKWSYGATTKEF